MSVTPQPIHPAKPPAFFACFYPDGTNIGMPCESVVQAESLVLRFVELRRTARPQGWFRPATPQVILGPGWAADMSDVVAVRAVDASTTTGDPDEAYKAAMMTHGMQAMRAQVRLLEAQVEEFKARQARRDSDPFGTGFDPTDD